jgi:hypothetical protein
MYAGGKGKPREPYREQYLLGPSSGKDDIGITLIHAVREDKSEADGPITKVNPPRVIASTRDKRLMWNYRNVSYPLRSKTVGA